MCKIYIKLNNIPVKVLIECINDIAENWLRDNQEQLKPFEELGIINILIVSAIRNKSKLICKQILLKYVLVTDR